MSKGIKLKDTDDLKTMGNMLAQSNLFDTKDDVAKAITKVEYGLELGLGPATAMSSVHVVKGKPALSAHVMSAKVKQSDKYNYTVEKHNDKGCVLQFWEKMGDEWVKAGTSKFTMKDAKQAELTGKSVWKKYPKNMVFSRAMSNGVKWYCPDLLIAGAYTPEELGDDGSTEVDVDEVAEQAKDVEETEFTIDEGNDTSKKKENSNDKSETSEDSDNESTDSSSSTNNESTNSDSSDDNTISKDQLKKLNTVGSKFYDELCHWKSSWDENRPDLVKQASDGAVESSTELTKGQAEALIDNIEKQLKKYKKFLFNYEDKYQIAKVFAGKLDGITGKGSHDELIEKINSIIKNESNGNSDSESGTNDSTSSETRDQSDGNNESSGNDDELENLDF